MPFHFTLDGVLRLRKSLERAELQKLQALALLLIATRAEMERAEQSLDHFRRETSARMTRSGLFAADLQFEIERENAFKRLLIDLGKRLSALEQGRQEQQRRYLRARQQREIISSLYERQLADYELHESRKRQRQIDEMFLLRKTSSAASESLDFPAPNND